MEYSGSNIKVLKGLEAVRKRPGMYIGDTGIDGLHHMVWEIVDNSVDEAMAGYGNTIEITLETDNSIKVSDNGRGIPVDIHPTEKIPTATVVLTVLHAGGKFDEDAYKTSGGLHGVGASVVNALSSKLIMTIQRDGTTYQQIFEKGRPVTKLEDLEKKSRQTGTTIHFFPDPTILKHLEYEPERLIKRIKNICFLNKGLKIIFNNKINNEVHEFISENGITDFMKDEIPEEKMLFTPVSFQGFENNIGIDFAFVYEKGFETKSYSFSNNVRTGSGGTHEIGATTAISRAILDNIKNDKTAGKDADKITNEDIKEGLFTVISVRVSQPELGGQTKDKLNNPEVRPAVYKVVKEKMEVWIEENPKIFKEIIKKILLAKKAREAAKKSRESVRKDVLSVASVLPGKLADCHSKNAEECEIFFVEGDSSGGSAKLGRNSETQAVLPLKGKILNVLKVKKEKAMQNEEILNIASALGITIGKEIDFSKLRYHKAIFMTDADIDGDHIGLLGIIFIHKYFPELIKNGHVYIVEPPLFRVKKNTGNESYYFDSEKALTKKFPTEESLKNWTVSRFKGLGEMNPEQLWETTMNPKTRNIIQLKYNDKLEISAETILNLIGGSDSDFRKWFLLNFTKGEK